MKIFLTFEVAHLEEARELLRHIPAEAVNIAHSHKQNNAGSNQEPAQKGLLPNEDAGAPLPRANIKPKGERASRVGAETQETVIAALQNAEHGMTGEELNRALLRGPGMLKSTVAVLNLLTDRKVINYDGEKYYV